MRQRQNGLAPIADWMPPISSCWNLTWLTLVRT